MDADVAIVGLGAMGSMTAWRLARSGASVLGFERFGLGHDRGASGGESRLFRMAYHEGPQYVPMLRAARDLWQELTDESGRPLYRRTGCLSIGRPELPPMRNVWRSVTDHGLEHEYLDHPTLTARYPQHRLAEGEVGVLDAEGAVLRPELAVLTANELARRHGARLLDRTPVEAIDIADDRVRIRAAGEEYTARNVVLTAGPWSASLLPELRPHLTLRPIVLTWFAPDDVSAYSPDRFPVFIRDTDGIHTFGVPVMDGISVKTGFADVWGDLDSPESYTRDLDESRLRPITDAVRRFLPGLHPDPIRYAVHFEGFTTDRTAMVGHMPGTDRAILLAGFSGHGFKLAPIFGRIAADLALHGDTELDITPMAPDRYL